MRGSLRGPSRYSRGTPSEGSNTGVKNGGFFGHIFSGPSRKHKGGVNNSFIYVYITTWDHYFAPHTFVNPNKHLWDKVKDKWLTEMPTTTKYSFMIWGPLHTLNFIFLPTQTRILFNSVGSTCWIAYLSIRGHSKINE